MRVQMLITNRRCILLAALVLLVGCSQKTADYPDLGTVTGVVMLDGKPLPLASILFQPDEGRASYATTDQNGKYQLTYTADATGAKLGRHTVQITTYRPNTDPKDLDSPEYPEQLPAKYHTKSELIVEVKPGKNDIPFDLKSK